MIKISHNIIYDYLLKGEELLVFNTNKLYMKNVIISFSIFVIMIIGMFFSLRYVNKICLELTETCDKLEVTITSEDWKKSYDDSLELLNDLKKESRIISMFINHQEIDHMTNELFKFTQYVKEKSKDEALASLHAIKFYIENIQEIQNVNIQNIL